MGIVVEISSRSGAVEKNADLPKADILVEELLGFLTAPMVTLLTARKDEEADPLHLPTSNKHFISLLLCLSHFSQLSGIRICNLNKK